MERGHPCAFLVGIYIGAASMGNNIEVSKKINNKTTIWPSNSTSGYLSEENENTNLKSFMFIPHVYCSSIYGSEDLGKNLSVYWQMNG